MTSPGVPCASQRAAQRVAHRAVELLVARPGVRRLERLDEVAEAHQLVAQVRALEPAVAPRLARRARRASPRRSSRRIRDEIDRRRSTSSASPSQPDDQHAAAGPPAQAQVRVERDRLKPRMPDSASETRVSSGSESRVTSGSASGLRQRPNGLGARPRSPRRSSPRSACLRGAGRTRTRHVRDHAERSLRADDQLAERGAGGGVRRLQRRERARPGVTISIAVTSSSKRPYPADAWPAERVAAKPPIVAYSKDCGKWPSVRPSRAQRGLCLGAAKPGPEARGQRGAVHLAVRAGARGRARSRRGAARASDRRRPRRWCRRRTGRPRRRSPRTPPGRPATCAADSGRTTASGAASRRPLRALNEIRIALAAARQHAVLVPGQQPRRAAARVTASGSARASGSVTLLELGAIGSARRRRAPRGASPARPLRARAASPGSPQPHHFIGSVMHAASKAGTRRPARARSRRTPRRGAGASRRASSASRGARGRAARSSLVSLTSVAPSPSGSSLISTRDSRQDPLEGGAGQVLRPGVAPALRCCREQR